MVVRCSRWFETLSLLARMCSLWSTVINTVSELLVQWVNIILIQKVTNLKLLAQCLEFEILSVCLFCCSWGDSIIFFQVHGRHSSMLDIQGTWSAEHNKADTVLLQDCLIALAILTTFHLNFSCKVCKGTTVAWYIMIYSEYLCGLSTYAYAMECNCLYRLSGFCVSLALIRLSILLFVCSNVGKDFVGSFGGSVFKLKRVQHISSIYGRYQNFTIYIYISCR